MSCCYEMKVITLDQVGQRPTSLLDGSSVLVLHFWLCLIYRRDYCPGHGCACVLVCLCAWTHPLHNGSDPAVSRAGLGITVQACPYTHSSGLILLQCTIVITLHSNVPLWPRALQCIGRSIVGVYSAQYTLHHRAAAIIAATGRHILRPQTAASKALFLIPIFVHSVYSARA